MACCKCCCGEVDCEEGQEGKCCCGGSYGECCQPGQYCCDGVCVDEPCVGCSGECEGDPDCDYGCVCVDGECVEEGACCFVDLSVSYSFTFLTYSGTLTLGQWVEPAPGNASLEAICTIGIPVCGSGSYDGLFIRFDDGTDFWEAVSPGNPLYYPCESSVSAAGTYTLTNCTTSATATLTLT